jgi:CysZ protein
MKNIMRSIERTVSQIFEPAFLKVFILGILTTLVAIVATWFLADYLKGQITLTQFDWQWVNDAFQWLLDVDWIFNIIFFFLMGIFFPPIATIFMTLYLDDIVDAVEDKYYPQRKAGKRLGVGHLAYLGVRLAFMIVLLNIIVIPLYLFFFWLPFVPLIIFYTLNSYLLGWGYYEMVAVRHLGIREAGRHRKSIRGQVLGGGFVITLLYSVPVVNLTAPILGAAILAHLFHLSLQDREQDS